MNFIPGLELSGCFFKEAVRPILQAHFPGLVYSAARLDFGSDVLGFDTPQSMDHGWGPKLTLFLTAEDEAQYQEAIPRVLGDELPFEFRGFPTHFGEPLADGGKLALTGQRPINHGVTVTTPARFFKWYLGIDSALPLNEEDWLLIPQQRLRTLASGRIYADGLAQLNPLRQSLQWYPQPVWLYLLACQWRKIDQEEPFMARCGDVGDELGSRLVASRLIWECMRLCFLMERTYAPYTKWFGTAFARLACAPRLAPLFQEVLAANGWKAREQTLSKVYINLAEMHNALGVTPPLEAQISLFYTRPYQVIHSGRFVEALLAQVQSPVVRAWRGYTGAVWQFVDSTDVLDDIDACQALRPVVVR
jgi:hypothetical protein